MLALMWRMQLVGDLSTKQPVTILTMLPRWVKILVLVTFLADFPIITIVGFTQVVQLLVKHGAEVDVCDQQGGTTPLHDAVSFGSKEVVEALLEAGARAGRKM